jgi:hypothetical protein
MGRYLHRSAEEKNQVIDVAQTLLPDAPKLIWARVGTA